MCTNRCQVSMYFISSKKCNGDFDTSFMRSYFYNHQQYGELFARANHHLTFELPFWKFYCFWHQVHVFINTTNVFQFGLLQFFVFIHEFHQCITVILMLIQDFITKKQLENVTLCFILLVGDFGTLVKISCKYLIRSFFWNHESYRNFWCWCKSYIYIGLFDV